MAIPFATSEVVTAAELNELARAHWRKTTAKQVVNTVTETDLLNGEITIDAGAMSTNRALRLTAEGDSVNNTGGAVAAPRFKLKLGATTLIDSNVLAGAWSFTAARLPWRVDAKIANLGATNAQWVKFDLEFAGSIAAGGSVALTTGEGWYTPLNNYFKVIGGASGAVDTTAAQGLALTVTLPTASASEDVTLKYASIEVV